MASTNGNGNVHGDCCWTVGGGVNKATRPLGSMEWIDAEMGTLCSPTKAKKTGALDGRLARCFLTVGIVLLLMQCSLAAEGKRPLIVSPVHSNL